MVDRYPTVDLSKIGLGLHTSDSSGILGIYVHPIHYPLRMQESMEDDFYHSLEMSNFC